MHVRSTALSQARRRYARAQQRCALLDCLESRVMLAAHLLITEQPAAAVAGDTFQYVVEVLNSAGVVDTTDSSMVTLSINNGPFGSTLVGTTTVQAVNGVATFTDLFLDKTGTYRLKATDGALPVAKSNTIKVAADDASGRLVVTQQGASTVVGKPVKPVLKIVAQDALGNILKTAKSTVTLSVVSGPGTLGGTVSGKLKNGVIVFSNLNLSEAGTYGLQATDASLPVTDVLFSQEIAQGVTTVGKPAVGAGFTFGKAFSLTSTLKSTAPGTVPFTGTVNLVSDGNTVLATATLTAAGVGKFTFVGDTLAPASYVCTVQFAGDTNHTAANSPSFTFKVNPATTKTVLTGSSPLFFGNALTLTATVNSTTAQNTARTGTIIFKDGATVLATVALDANSQATFSTSSATVGSHHYTATYSADGNFKASSDSESVLIKKDISATTIDPAAGPVTLNADVTLTAHVTLTAGTNTPTGVVTFKDGAKVLGTANIDASGVATLATSFDKVGTHAITALFGGDGQTMASHSASSAFIVA